MVPYPKFVRFVKQVFSHLTETVPDHNNMRAESYIIKRSARCLQCTSTV
jgi:hypothetical protein